MNNNVTKKFIMIYNFKKNTIMNTIKKKKK